MGATEDNDLSGAGLSAKDLLREVRLDVKAMSKNVDILVSQNLDNRLKTVESWKDQLTGKLLVVSAGISILTAAAVHFISNYVTAVIAK